jgi:uncharacterized membrane protein
MISPVAIAIMVIGSFTGAFALLFLKKGSKKFNFKILQQIKNYYLIIGIFLYLLGFAFYIYALTLERLSVLYPFSALNYLWVSLISIKFLGEKMNQYKWTGLVLIILGIALTYFAA